MKFEFQIFLLFTIFLMTFPKSSQSSAPSHHLTHSTYTTLPLKSHSSHLKETNLSPNSTTASHFTVVNLSAPINNQSHGELALKLTDSSLTHHQGTHQFKVSASNIHNGSSLSNLDSMKSNILIQLQKPIDTAALRTEKIKPKVESKTVETKGKSKEGYFTKTSRQYRKAGPGVVGAFVCGWILFFVSICFICWNERNSVKDTEALDYLSDVCYDGTNGTLSTDTKYKNFNLFCGTARVEKPAEIANLGLFSDKTAFISTTIEKFNGKEVVVKENEDEDETSQREKENWGLDAYLEKVVNSIYNGEVIVNENNIKFESNLLRYSSKKYRFLKDKRVEFEAFVKSQSWKYSSDAYCVV